MATKRKRQGGKTNRKLGRNEVKCKRYRAENRREKNKIRKIRKHLKRHINDRLAKRSLQKFIKFIYN